MADWFMSLAGAGGATGADWANREAFSQAALQAAIDQLTGGDILYLEDDTYTLSANLDLDVLAGTAYNAMAQILGVNSSGADDGSRAIIDGNSAASDCLDMGTAGKDYIHIKNLEIINATANGIFTSTNSINCIFENLDCNNNNMGISSQTTTYYAKYMNCSFNNNSHTGLYNTGTCSIRYCNSSNNQYGFNSIANTAPITHCLIYGNSVANILNASIIENCTIDGTRGGTNTPTGVSANTYSSFNNRITNHSGWGFNSGLATAADNNYYYANTSGDIDVPSTYSPATYDRLSAANSADGYTDASTGDYTLTAGGDGVGVAIPIGLTDETTNVSYITQGGMNPLAVVIALIAGTLNLLGVGR